MSAGAWWDAWSAAGGVEQLEEWLGGVDAYSRVRIRQRVGECGYQTVLDCGAGLGVDYIGFKANMPDVQWCGLEPSTALHGAAAKLAWRFGHEAPAMDEGRIQEMPYADDQFEFVYARHILEHLPRFDAALSEMDRVALLEYAVVFFMRPAAQTYLTRESDGLWQNVWSLHDIEAYLLTLPNFGVRYWEHLHGNEVILHVYTRHAIETVDPERVARRLEPEPEPEDEPEAEE